MSKKNFKGGLDSLLGDAPDKAPKRSNTKSPAPTTAPVSSVKEGIPPTKTRATFIVDEALLSKVKALAYWERLQMKEVIDLLLQGGIDAYEKANGKLKPVPNKR